MTLRVKTITGREGIRPAELFMDANVHDADYMVVEVQPSSTSPDLMINSVDPKSSTDLIVISDPVSRAPWRRLREVLPPFLYLTTAIPEHDSAIAVAVSTLKSHTDIVHRSETLGELVVRLAELGTTTFVEDVRKTPAPTIPVPHLTTPTCGPQYPWLREFIQRIQIPKSSSTNLTALKAGLFLLNDFFDESHSCSQSIEGLGTHHTGDYWHAILHRREPDYGNSKYWFRHVGRHPSFTELARAAGRHMEATNGSLTSKLDRWKDRLVAGGEWDPFAFVDLCAAAESDSKLQEWCARLQHQEMLLLLESTYRDTVNG
jgi:hypothetical protein